MHGVVARAGGHGQRDEIASVDVVTYRGQRFLGIALTDPQTTLGRVRATTRWLARVNEGLTGVPLHIAQSVLPMSAETLSATLGALKASACTSTTVGGTGLGSAR